MKPSAIFGSDYGSRDCAEVPNWLKVLAAAVIGLDVVLDKEKRSVLTANVEQEPD